MKTGAQLYTVRAYTQKERDFEIPFLLNVRWKRLHKWGIKQCSYQLLARI